jgi:hypothetical protein
MTNPTAKQKLLDFLLRCEGRELLDIKFCPGTEEDVSEERFASSILFALQQASSPEARVFAVFREEFPAVRADTRVVAA